MSSLLPHPAITRLVGSQTLASMRCMGRRMLTRRRIVLSVVAVILAILWIGNVTLSVLVRHAFDPEKLQRYLPLGMLAYAMWHVVKVAYQRPDAGIHWTSAEEELLCAKPFSRRDLLLYSFASIGPSVLVKAFLMTVLLSPDMPLPMIGGFGALLALFFLDLFRMGVQITAWGMSTSLYNKLRVVVFLAIAALGAAGVMAAARVDVSRRFDEANLASRLTELSLQPLEAFAETPVGTVMLAVPQAFTNVILAPRYDAALAAWLALAVALVLAMGWLVLRADAYFEEASRRRERESYAKLGFSREQSAVSCSAVGEVQVAAIPRLGGVGAIAWRQVLGASGYRGSVLVAVAVPGALACFAWFLGHDAATTLWYVTGTLAFYSLLLLPSALRFDFRRELSRMVLLKSLPFRPSCVVLGQLFTPVLIAGVMQTVVIGATAVAFSLSPKLAITALVLLWAANVLIFSLDNLIFLWFPHHLEQEGVDVFVRTTLTFMAKGLLFSGALAAVVGWAMTSNWLAESCQIRNDFVFLSGLLVLFLLGFGLLFGLLVRAYDRFDPSEDMPG